VTSEPPLAKVAQSAAGVMGHQELGQFHPFLGREGQAVGARGLGAGGLLHLRWWCPRIMGPKEHMKSMYSLPSTSLTRHPSPLVRNMGRSRDQIRGVPAPCIRGDDLEGAGHKLLAVSEGIELRAGHVKSSLQARLHVRDADVLTVGDFVDKGDRRVYVVEWHERYVSYTEARKARSKSPTENMWA